MIFTWKLQGVSDTEISETDYLLFSAGTYNTNIIVGEFNDSTHVKTDAGVDKSSANTPNNNKYISATEVSLNGGATQDLDTATDSDAVLTINVTDGTFAIEDALFFTFDGSSPSQQALGLDTYSAEVGDTNWSHSINRTHALALTDKISDTSHDYFILLSISPTNPGICNGTMRLEGVMS